MDIRFPLVAISTLLVITSHLYAGEFSVKIPRSCETEVFVEARYGEQFDPVQFQISEINFNDFENFRLRSFNATTVKRDLVKEGLNLSCGESEIIVVGGQMLSLTRKSDIFQGSIPTTREVLEAMLDENCRMKDWNVAFASNDNHSHRFLKELERLPGLGIVLGSLDLLHSDKLAFSVPHVNNQMINTDEIKFSSIVNKVTHSTSIQQWHDGWRVSRLESTYSNPPFVIKRSVNVQDSELVLDSSISKNVNAPESRAKARMYNIRLDGDSPIELTHRIANGTRVSLQESPQIKAVWMDGKVVRVYEGGTVDDLGSATFRTPAGSYGIVKILLITLVFACVGGALIWMRRSRLSVK